MTAPGFVQGVIVPPAVCLFLERSFDFTRLRGAIRGDDPDVDHTLREIHRVAMALAGRVDTTPTATETRPEVHWLTPGQAATRLGVAEDTVRRAIREHRLPAEKHARTWHIRTTDLNTYRPQRSST